MQKILKISQFAWNSFTIDKKAIPYSRSCKGERSNKKNKLVGWYVSEYSLLFWKKKFFFNVPETTRYYIEPISNMRVHEECVVAMVKVIENISSLKMPCLSLLNSVVGRRTHTTFIHKIKLVTHRATKKYFPWTSQHHLHNKWMWEYNELIRNKFYVFVFTKSKLD